ncbi:MAG: tRNA lysidine(34) synthetase TilS, partial [Firmicutes bacterium]|nr:tRNA lysidine(34) synthetase TilS [Bacillota bacterium]
WMHEAIENYLQTRHIVLDDVLVRLPADFQAQPVALQRACLRAYADRHQIRLEARHIDRALQTRQTCWPHGYQTQWQKDGALWLGRRLFHEEPDERISPVTVLHPGIPLRIGQGSVHVGTALLGSGEERGLQISMQKWPAIGVRIWRAGDRLAPLGLNGHKKVQDILTDAKISGMRKKTWPVIVGGAADDAPVIAVAGVCIDESCRAHPGDRVYTVKWCEDSGLK